MKDYYELAMKEARFEILSDDGSYYGEIPSCQGVYANASTLDECRAELVEVLEDWVHLRVALELDLPDLLGG